MQVDGTTTSDRGPSRRLVELCNDSRVRLLDADLTWQQLTALYGACRFVDLRRANGVGPRTRQRGDDRSRERPGAGERRSFPASGPGAPLAGPAQRTTGLRSAGQAWRG